VESQDRDEHRTGTRMKDGTMKANRLTDPAPSPHTSAAERMRRHRERRRDGFLCLTIEVHAAEIDALIQRGDLQAVHRDEIDAIREAFYAFLDKTLRLRP
jgi:hypothetical protein